LIYVLLTLFQVMHVSDTSLRGEGDILTKQENMLRPVTLDDLGIIQSVSPYKRTKNLVKPVSQVSTCVICIESV